MNPACPDFKKTIKGKDGCAACGIYALGDDRYLFVKPYVFSEMDSFAIGLTDYPILQLTGGDMR